ncbi:phage tail tape measure protein [Methylococcus sp. EFPC2]|uniref:phage tail tape measure protein n=1 Tax=Methylococcus sp. EFPC2 TaxID=2812648 RepID=UPI001967ED6A|nr:phage tail tape measure protein [Methylococcus sp. EFPC2]QSA97118.1 phage tail tape measure protein [Methylococcus sp. EFPC2]
MGDLEGSVRDVAAPLASLADTMATTEAAAIALGAALVGAVVHEAGKFSDSVKEIGTLFNGSSEAIGRFGRDVLNYGQDSTQSIESLNGALYEAISSGVDYNDALGLINTTERLSVAGKADLTETTKVLVSALNAYGLSTKDAGRFSDDLFQTVKLGQTTLPELAQSISQVTGIAAGSGVSFEELNAAIAALTVAGLPTSEAITAIRSALSNIIKPSSEAAKIAEDLGLKFDASALSSKGFSGVLGDVFKATGGNIDVMAKLFGSVEGLNGAMVLGADKSGKFKEALAAMANASGTVDQAFNIMADNVGLSVQRLVNSIEVAAIKAGQPLLEEFGGVTKALAAIFQGLGAGIDAGAFDPLLNALQAFGGEAERQLQAIAANLPEALSGLDFTGLIDSFHDLGGELSTIFEDVFGRVDLSTPEGLRAALQRLVDGFEALTRITTGIGQGMEPFFRAMGSVIDHTVQAGDSTQELGGRILGFARVIESAGPVLDEFQNTMHLVATSLSLIAGAQTIGAVKTIGSLAAAAGPAAVIMGGLTVAVAPLAGALGYSVGTGLAWAIDKVVGKLTGGDSLGTLIYDLTHKAEDLTATATTAAGGVATMGRALDGAGQSSAKAHESFKPIDLTGFNAVAEAAKRMGVSLDDAGAAATKFSDGNAKVEQLATGYTKVTDALGNLHLVWPKAEEAATGYKEVVDDLGRVSYVQLGNAVDRTNKALSDQGGKLAEVEKQAREFDLKLREIQSKERIAVIEAKVKIDQAQIEADLKRVQAVFSSIDAGIKSTGDVLGKLNDAMKGASEFDKLGLQDQIREEQKRRAQEFEQQKKLTEEQLKYLQARRQKLNQGDALVKVESGTLQPALEMIFHEILKACQLRANQEGLEFLIGAL